jgi:hypothetical protein
MSSGCIKVVAKQAIPGQRNRESRCRRRSRNASSVALQIWWPGRPTNTGRSGTVLAAAATPSAPFPIQQLYIQDDGSPWRRHSGAVRPGILIDDTSEVHVAKQSPKHSAEEMSKPGSAECQAQTKPNCAARLSLWTGCALQPHIRWEIPPMNGNTREEREEEEDGQLGRRFRYLGTVPRGSKMDGFGPAS